MNPVGRSVVLMACLLLAAGCSRDTEDRTQVQLPQPPATDSGTGIEIRALSTKSWLVTGGDALLEVAWADLAGDARMRVELNGRDITSGLRSVPEANVLRGLVAGLDLGDNKVTATLASGDETRTESLVLTNYPITGPIISGPQEQPFQCQTQQFTLVTGESLGPALDSNCSVATRVDYVYFSVSEEIFKPYPAAASATRPEDVADLTLPDGGQVPFVVRVETGTVNRAIYEIAMLHLPGTPDPGPWNQSDGWNGKLVYTHGGGCRGGWYQQGERTGGVLHRGLLEMGYALASSTLNVFGQNCNDLLASETHIMVKERFIENYGEPLYTIATGSSGGSYQSHQTADNYPGVFDGIIVSSSFPDVTSATIFTLADARLLHYYFTVTNPETFTVEQQQAVAGFGSWGSIPNLARGAARLDPVYDIDTPPEEQGGELRVEALQYRRYSANLPQGVRATVYDHTVNVYGRVDDAPVAARPLDNVGVQYGLAALNAGTISARQFIDLNRGIGGFDRDLNHIPERHRADPPASRRAIESGRILSGGGGLRETPVIDYRTYTDHREGGDIHMIVHQFSTRQRLVNANGHADNHVMAIGGLWDFTEQEPDLGNLFRSMDEWLMAIAENRADVERSIKVIAARPGNLSDSCWDYSGEQRTSIREPLSFAGNGRCAELYPVYATPRQVAGAPLANDIVSCQLRPPDPADYAVAFTQEEWQELEGVFPAGVCDWNRPDLHQASYQGTWQSFGPSPVNRAW